MKVYGNSKGDGFGLLSIVMGGVFAAGGFGLAFVGGFTLFLSLTALVVVTALMMRGLKNWSVMSEVPALVGVPSDIASLPSFPMAAQSDAAPSPIKPAWIPTADAAAHLPAHVERPKAGVVTNTPVV
jgi:hypothetical protein